MKYCDPVDSAPSSLPRERVLKRAGVWPMVDIKIRLCSTLYWKRFQLNTEGIAPQKRENK